jgi:Flp pilus assembly protein TadG
MKIPNLKSKLKTLHNYFLRNSYFMKDEEGSAIVEFVILALPLFIPMALYLTTVSQTSQIQFDARNYVRQVARVYVTSPSQSLVADRISVVTQTFADSIFLKDKIAIPPTINIWCSRTPCLTPGGKIQVSVRIDSLDSKRAAFASVIESVDAWRSS